MLEMRAYSSPAPCGPEGPRADGGGPGWGWPLTKKGRPEGRPKFWEETPNGRRVARRDRDNAVHNIEVIPPGFKKDFPFLLRRIICRRQCCCDATFRQKSDIFPPQSGAVCPKFGQLAGTDSVCSCCRHLAASTKAWLMVMPSFTLERYVSIHWSDMPAFLFSART